MSKKAIVHGLSDTVRVVSIPRRFIQGNRRKVVQTKATDIRQGRAIHRSQMAIAVWKGIIWKPYKHMRCLVVRTHYLERNQKLAITHSWSSCRAPAIEET